VVKSVKGVEEVLNKSEGPWGQRQVALTVFSEFVLSVSTPHLPSPVKDNIMGPYL